MGIMPDFWIKEMAKTNNMINPFVEKLVKNVLSYCLSLTMVMIQELMKISKFLLMLTPQPLIQSSLIQVLLIEKVSIVLYLQIVLC